MLTEIPTGSLIKVGIWLLAALIIHDAVISPGVVGVGWTLRRNVPDRERRYLQWALIMIAMVTVIALPMIFLRGGQPPVKALLLRDYATNLTLLIGLIAGVTAVSYASACSGATRAHHARGSQLVTRVVMPAACITTANESAWITEGRAPLHSNCVTRDHGWARIRQGLRTSNMPRSSRSGPGEDTGPRDDRAGPA